MLRQSGVIPYRQGAGGVEIMLITSTNTGRWQVPKGMLEPGLTAVESAEQEGFEEAGVFGQAHEEAIFAYRYRKSGRWPARVDLYPMPVSPTESCYSSTLFE